MMSFAALLLYVFAVLFGQRVIKRAEGAVLFLCFVLYTAYLIAQL